MAVDGQEDENGKDILELGDESDLPFALWIKNICSGKAHLETDDGCTKLNRGKNQPGDKTQQEA